MSEPLPPREFTTTRWSVVLRAGGGSPEEAQVALERLCRDYWYPLYAYVRRKGHSPEDASDLTQDFFAKLLANDFAQGISPEGGRFRSFLLTALNRFLVDEWRRSHRQKRGGNAFIGSLDALISERGEASYVGEASSHETPEQLYQRAWAETLLTRVLQRLADECARKSEVRFEVMEPFLALSRQPPALADAAAQLGLTLPAFKSQLHRLRQRYRELLFDEVSQTVGVSGEVEEELRGLLQAMQ
jgi:RNA polymerase sigma-70 factor (ECF subfamily)